MERSARRFLCARCRVAVVLCSHCDRGQRYCTRECSALARRAARREACRRYQLSRRGRLAHANRSRNWRQRQKALVGATGEQGRGDEATWFVTHQGCPVAAPDASLVACPADPAPDAATFTTAVVAPPGGPVWRCRRCAHPLLPHVRIDFLRRSAPRPIRRHDHFPCPDLT